MPTALDGPDLIVQWHVDADPVPSADRILMCFSAEEERQRIRAERERQAEIKRLEEQRRLEAIRIQQEQQKMREPGT